MKKRQMLLAVVCGAMLAITGCGDDDPDPGDLDPILGTGGTAGSGGTAGTGGGGASSSTCEAICSSPCVLEGVDPEGNQCLTQCQAGVPQFDDECGSQADAYLACIAAVNCDPEASQCQSQAIAWGTCIAGAFQ